jgi:hypothetical protein
MRGQLDMVVCPVMIDQTCPVSCGCLLETIGRSHYGVRFVKRARLVEVSCVRVVRDLRVWSWTLARLVALDCWHVEGDC